jgi:hypothetical protein
MEWFLHEDHGYMLRGPVIYGWQMVVTALCCNTREDEDDPALWEAHKSRLHVNAGSGAIAADLMRPEDHNPDFKPIDATRVPAHIRHEFVAYL